jgi:putative ABC transport system permease protein
MFKNYFKIALRNLLKNKTYSIINVFGLAIAFLCSILLFLNAYDELSFDNFHLDKDRIYKCYNYSNGADGEQLSGAMGYPVAPTLKTEVPEIEAATRYMWSGGGVEYQGKKLDLQVNLVDNYFFNVFTFPLLKGDKLTPLADVGNVVISEYAAKRIFNKQDAIGKTLKVKVSGEWKDLVVSAVAKDFPKNSSITFDVLVRPELNRDYELNKANWNNQHHDVYVKISAKASKENVENKFRYLIKKYQVADSMFMKRQGYKADEKGDYLSLKLLPISEIHFHSSLGVGNNITSRTYIYTLLLISFFILAIACFNFINLTIAQSFTRAKEVGIRKCLGADRKQIFVQISGESFLICTIALSIGLVFATLVFPYFNQLFGAHLSLNFFYKPSTIFMIISSTLFVSFFAGGYPAYIVSKLNTTSVLKGKLTLKKSGFFRNALIVLQFSMACLLMICTIVAYKQFEYMRTMPLGFNKESIISIPLSNRKNGRATLNQFRNRLASQASILSITGTNINIGLGKDGNRSKQSTGFGFKDKSILTNWLSADYDFLKTLGIKLIKGRDFSKDYATDTVSNVLVTESMAKQFMEKEILGLTFSIDSAKPPFKIIGLIPDFHLYSLHEKTEPLTIDMSSNNSIGYVLIKTTSANPLALMNQLERIFKEVEPDKEFKGSFMDENTDRWYNKEKKLSLLLGTSSIIAIVLSCLGLFALALLMIQQRIKEIGVRKVLGASIFNINNLLTKDFLKLVIAAIVIASPIAWWIMNEWLQDFPYRTSISWLVFIAVGLAAMTISLATISFNTIKAALANPVKNLRTE